MTHHCETILSKDVATFRRILHISDLHIRLASRFKEYNLVFQSFVHRVAEFPESIVVITGDVFHTKNELTPDCVMLCVNFLRNLSKRAPVVIIPGNHDMVMHNLDKCDTITSVLHRRNLSRVYYLRASGVYRFGNLVYIHNSLWRPGDDAWIHAERHALHLANDDVLVHLYHGTVGACQTLNGIRFSDSLSLSKFDGADMVLLGDVHRHQLLAPHVAYAGSMISQNFNETDDEHGFIEWNVSTKSPTFHPLTNPYCFRHVDVHADGTIVHQGKVYTDWKALFEHFHPKMRVQILIHDAPECNVQTIREACRAFGFQQPRVRHAIRASSSPTLQANGARPSVGEHGIEHELRGYLEHELSVTSKDTIDECVRTLREHVDVLRNASSSSLSPHVGARWRILDLSFDHLFGYGKGNALQFQDPSSPPEIVGIFGQNSAGKSTLVDILFFMLYGRITRYASGNTIPKELIHEAESSFQATLRIQVGSEVYRIEKHGKRDKKTLRIRVHESVYHECPSGGGGGRDVNLTEEHRLKSDKIVRDLIGPMDQFLHLSVCLQHASTKSFKEMTQKERKEFMYTVFQMDGFDAYRQDLLQEQKALEIRLRVLEAQRQAYHHHHRPPDETSIQELEVAWKACRASREEAESFLALHEETHKQRVRVELEMETTKQSLTRELERVSSLESQLLQEFASGCPSSTDDTIQELESRARHLGAENALDIQSRERCDPPVSCLSFSFREYLKTRHHYLVDKDEDHTQQHKSLPQITTCSDDNGFVYVYFRDKYYAYKLVELTKFMHRELPLIQEEKERVKNYRLRVQELDLRRKMMRTELATHAKATYDDACTHCQHNPFRIRKTHLERELENIAKSVNTLQQKIDYEERQMEKRAEEANLLVLNIYAWANDKDDDDDVPRPSFPTLSYPLPPERIHESLLIIQSDLHERMDAVQSFRTAMDVFIRRHVRTYQEKCRETFTQQSNFLESLDRYIVVAERNRQRHARIAQRTTERQNILTQIEEIRTHQRRYLQLKTDTNIAQRTVASLKLTLKELEEERGRLGGEDDRGEEVARVRGELRRWMEEEVRCEHELGEQKKAWETWKAVEGEVVEISASLERVQLLLRVTDRDGFALHLLRRTIPTMATYINSILQHFLDRRIHFDVDAVDGNVEFHTVSEDSNMTLHFYGGMESLMIDLAIKITFAHFGLCPMSAFFIIDENISVLDEHHIQHISVLFEFLKQHFDSVLMISHIPTIKSMVDRVVHIHKNGDGYSSIVTSHSPRPGARGGSS